MAFFRSLQTSAFTEWFLGSDSIWTYPTVLTLHAAGMAMDPDADMPRTMKLVGACSLFSWFAVLYCGRMLPYLGTGN